MIYLDNCATTAVDEDVAYAAFEMMRKFYGNPSSPYGLGREVLRRVTEARHQVAQVIGAPTERLFFTSGGTEANNLALQGTLAALAISKWHPNGNIQQNRINLIFSP